MLQCTILEVALASISTLGLFDHAEIGPGRRKYTSAGMNHTNPIKDVLDEAEQIFGKEKRVACILSLGAGVPLQMTMPSNLAHLEVHGLLQAMEMQQAVVTEEIGRRFGTLEVYYRFSIPGIGSGCLSDWTSWDMDTIEHHAEEYLNSPNCSKELDTAAEQLSAGRGTITLDGLSKLQSLGMFSSLLMSNFRQRIRNYGDSQNCPTSHSILRVAKEIVGIHRGKFSKGTNRQAEHIRSLRNGWVRQVYSPFILCASIWVKVSECIALHITLLTKDLDIHTYFSSTPPLFRASKPTFRRLFARWDLSILKRLGKMHSNILRTLIETKTIFSASITSMIHRFLYKSTSPNPGMEPYSSPHEIEIWASLPRLIFIGNSDP
jgi:hypothetical protein